MWLFPVLLIGFFAYALGRERGAVKAALPAASAKPPSPITVLGEFARTGQIPPPPIILFAIAEAEALGRCDIAANIVRTFVEPVVQREYQRGSCATQYGEYQRGGSCAIARPVREPRCLPQPKPAVAVRIPSDQEIRQMLDANPEQALANMAALYNGQLPVDPPSQPLVAVDNPPLVRLPPAPIPGVQDDVWDHFCSKLEREAPNYQTSRHVGMYRQRRERLSELAIDPDSLVTSPETQRAALDADLADACRHIGAPGLADEHLHRPISIDAGETHNVTLSGILSVVQAAGLEGAVGWLENPDDRKRFPHTTQAFLRGNGVF